MFLDVWFEEQKGSVSRGEQLLVQLSLSLPQVQRLSGFRVVSEDERGFAGLGEGPGEGEVLETMRGDTWDGQCVTLLLCYII